MIPGRGPQAIPSDPKIHAPNAALLIDFDNVTMGIRSDLQNQLRKLLNSAIIKGKVAVQRAYADWRRYPQYIVPLSEASIDLIFAPAFGANKKNATDIRLAIDALELVFTRPEIGTFILLSGDSDFSSLVLKLKEYGKYIVGVGIRESASDLLVQNCDEYYSYSELTGLAREGEVQILHRDPWELVVEAACRMKEREDVMRSDRLKQVMQEIDAHFDEKDAGFNRFSKFVIEAGRRGLLQFVKMENGQYEIDVGPDANVPLEAAPAGESAPPVRAKRKRTRTRVEKAAGAGGLTLATAFALVKDALTDLGAVDKTSADAENVRERMIALAGSDGDPTFEPRRFQRLLRQAHDAGIIELVKSTEGGYLLKLMPEAETGEEVVEADETVAREASPTPKTDSGTAEPRMRRKAAGGRAAGRSKKPESEVDKPVVTEEPVTTGPTEEKPETRKPAAKRKRASRKKRTTASAADGETAAGEPEAAAAPDSTEKVSPKRKKAKTTSRSRAADTQHKHATTRERKAEAPNVERAPSAEGSPQVAGSGGAAEQTGAAAPSTSAKRNPRFRRGSRGAGRRATPGSQEKAAAPPTESSHLATPSVPEEEVRPESAGRRSLRSRPGSRSRGRAPAAKQEKKTAASPPEPRVEPDTEPRAAATPPEAPAEAEQPSGRGGGLFKRMTDALHKAVLGDGSTEEE
jgi:uncharacterized protein (TIGR00288 family)